MKSQNSIGSVSRTEVAGSPARDAAPAAVIPEMALDANNL